jgi:hypothetical protein
MFGALTFWVAAGVVGSSPAYAQTQTEIVLGEHQWGDETSAHYTYLGKGYGDIQPGYPLFGQFFTAGVSGEVNKACVKVQSDTGYLQSGIYVSIYDLSTYQETFVYVPEETLWSDLGWREASFAGSGVTLVAGQTYVLFVESYGLQEYYRIYYSVSDDANDYYPGHAMIAYYYDPYSLWYYDGGFADMDFATYLEVEVTPPPPPPPCGPDSGDLCINAIDQAQMGTIDDWPAPLGQSDLDFQVYSYEQTFTPQMTGYLFDVHLHYSIDLNYFPLQSDIRVSVRDLTSGEVLGSVEVTDAKFWLGGSTTSNTVFFYPDVLIPIYAADPNDPAPKYSIVVEAIDPTDHYLLYYDWDATDDPYPGGKMRKNVGGTWSDYYPEYDTERTGYADMAFWTVMRVAYEPPPPPPPPICLATGTDPDIDGYLEVCGDRYGAVAAAGHGVGLGDRYNPPGDIYGPDSPTWASEVFFFQPESDSRAVLSVDGVDGYFPEDDSVVIEVTSVTDPIDTDGDEVVDQYSTQFTLSSGNDAFEMLVFDLTQSVVKVAPGISSYVREYTVTYPTDTDTGGDPTLPVDFFLVLHADVDSPWVAGYDDNVGTRTNSFPWLDRSVYVGDYAGNLPVVETTLTLSSPDADAYYAIKHGFTLPDSTISMQGGTSRQIWDNNGVLVDFLNYIPTVGYDLDGDSGSHPGDCDDPCDAAIGLQVPVSLDPGDVTTVSFTLTYGEILPVADTDGDGLTDGDEVYVYSTSPLDDDTDGDGFLDGDEVAAGTDPTVFDLEIDIKPGGDPNCFNLDGHGVIPIAILGSAFLDVTDIDFETVLFEGMAVKAVGRANRLLYSFEDVNGDGYLDAVVQIEDMDAVLTLGTAAGKLTGLLVNERAFQGTDEICIVP